MMNKHMKVYENHLDKIQKQTNLVVKKENDFSYFGEKSLLEALPQEILIKILSGVDHDDLKRLYHVSKPIREAAVIAKEWHFHYTTPTKIPAFRYALNLEKFALVEYEEIEAPNAPMKRSTDFHSQWTRKNWDAFCLPIFALSP